MQSQLMCSGCRTLLLYPRGAINVCCAICNTVTPVTPAVTEMAQIVCGGCQILLMYPRGASTVRCSCCNTINVARAANQVAQVSCGQCRTTLMYPYGAPSVKCAVCHYVTNIGMSNIRPPTPMPPTTTPPLPNSSTSMRSKNVTVVVENPMSVNENGKLVSNVVVGVTTNKK
ncbi:Protein LOL3 [Apostasia shenzhenica]|uniref:Protein LOL3 n=1 Tax=Apostasia shenzhenica TaxID=1088818 RepID=A0A2I0BE09_9ASPA|nr:Protein LOL3 [Apostasia shenzhenica]